MSISSKQNRSMKNSLAPNLIRIIVKNHNGAIIDQETVPASFFHGTMNRLKEKYNDLYKISYIA